MDQSELSRTKPEAEQSMPSAWFFSDEGKKRINFQREKLVISYIGSRIDSKNHNNISGNLRPKRMKMSHNQCKILEFVYD